MTNVKQTKMTKREATLKKLNIEDVKNLEGWQAEGVGNNLIFINDYRGEHLSGASLRLGFMVLCYCERGSASARLSDKRVEMKSGDMLVTFGEQVVEDIVPSADFYGRIALISREYCLESLVGTRHLWPYIFYVFEHPVFTFDANEREWLRQSFDVMTRRLRDQDHRYFREALVSQLRVFLYDVCAFLAARVKDVDVGKSRGYTIFGDFIALVEQHFKTHRDVLWYSEQLCLTSKYLSEVVKRVSGRTSASWISQVTIAEIKNLLKDPSLSIKEVADRMNFKNQSILGKYFKMHTGVSPSEYRQ